MNPQNHPLYEGIVDIAAAVQAAERAAEQHIISVAHLTIRTLETQQRFGVSPHVAQPAIEHLRRAMDVSFEGRDAVVAAHSAYGKIAAAAGASADTFGPTWPCTKGFASSAQREDTQLRAVA